MNEIDFLLKTWEIQAQDGYYFFLATKSKKTGNWKDHDLKWPITKKTLKEWFEEYPTEQYNLYFCPLAFKGKKRDKSLAVRTKYLWADLDSSNPRKCDPVPQIAWESSPKRFAALWILTDFLDPDEAEQVNKELTYATGADKGCWNLTRVLRIPGSCNHKYEGSPKGKLLWYKDNEYSLDKFQTKPNELDSVEVFKRVKNKLKPATLQLLTAKSDANSDRSKVLWKLQRSLIEQGCTSDEVYSLVKDTVWNKFRGRTDEYEQLTRELDKSKGSGPALAGLDAKGDKPTRTEPLLVRMSDVEPEYVQFLWYPYIPQNKITLVEGDPGLGKSWFTMNLAAAVSSGKKLPSMTKGVKGKVLLMSAEDGIADTIRPRLDTMADVNLKNIYFYNSQVIFDEMGIIEVEEQIAELQPKLVIIDPLVAYMGGKIDINKANETRSVMTRLAQLGEKYKCSIVCLRHLTKGSKDKSIYRGLGSIDITAAARSAIIIGRNPDDIEGRVMVHIKSNLAPFGPSLKYELRPGASSPFNWQGECDYSAMDVLGEQSGGGAAGKNELDIAKEFLSEALEKGPERKQLILREGEARGITTNAITKAKKALKIQSSKVDSEYVWQLSSQQE